MEIWRYGNMEMWKYGKMEIQKYGNTEIQKYGNTEIQKQAVAELCQAQVQFKLNTNSQGEDWYMYIQKLNQKIDWRRNRFNLALNQLYNSYAIKM